MAQAEALCPFQTTLDGRGQPPEKRGRATPEGHHSVFVYKLKAITNSMGSYTLADMETSDNTLNQVHSIFVNWTWIR